MSHYHVIVKRYISNVLKSISFCYISFPLWYLIFCAVIFDIPFKQCVRILLSPLYWIAAILSVVTGFGLYEMRRWAWYIFIIDNVLIGYGNALLVNDYSESHHKFIAYIGSIFLLILMIYRVSREIRVPYFFPKIRWWESDPRYRLSVNAELRRGEETPMQGHILDISMGGCFVKTRLDIPQDEILTLKFLVFGETVECRGFVVWRTQSTVTHPKGLGVKFSPLDRVQKRSLRKITRKLKKIARFYRRSRYLMNQEDFLKRMQEYEKI